MQISWYLHEFYWAKSETLWIFPPADVVTRADTDKPNLTHICQHATRLIAPTLISESRLRNYYHIVITGQSPVPDPV